jgi:hypothetical protein
MEVSKMVVCNLCMKKKPIEQIEDGFRYVCKNCFNKMVVLIDGVEIDKAWLC